MAYDFDETSPADNDYISDYPGNERDARAAKKNAFEVDHELTDGYHEHVTLNELAADPDLNEADKLSLYAKNDSGQPELFLQEESVGDVIQLTKDGAIHGALSLLAASPVLERTMEEVVLLANTIALQGKESGGTARALLQMLVGDSIEVGDDAVELAFKVLSLANFKVLENGGAGPRKILTEEDVGDGNGLDADLLDGIHGAGYLRTPSASVSGVFYKSAATTVGPSGEQLFAHDLGDFPNLVTVVLKCVTSEHGFAIDDEVPVTSSPAATPDTSSFGVIAIADDTNIEIRRGSGVIQLITNATTNYWITLTENRWKFIVRAWK